MLTEGLLQGGEGDLDLLELIQGFLLMPRLQMLRRPAHRLLNRGQLLRVNHLEAHGFLRGRRYGFGLLGRLRRAAVHHMVVLGVTRAGHVESDKSDNCRNCPGSQRTVPDSVHPCFLSIQALVIGVYKGTLFLVVTAVHMAPAGDLGTLSPCQYFERPVFRTIHLPVTFPMCVFFCLGLQDYWVSPTKASGTVFGT